MALHLLDEVRGLLLQKKGITGESLKENEKVQDALGRAEASLESCRAWLYLLVHEA